MLCGGTSGDKEANEEIQKVIEEIREELERKLGRHFDEYKAHSYKTQVVAGTNIFIKVLVDKNKGEYIHVRVFKALPCNGGKLELHGHVAGKTVEDAIDFF